MRTASPKRLFASSMTGMILLALTASCEAQTSPQWKTYPYAADGFSAMFPAQPEMTSQNVNTAAGPFELRSYTVQIDQVALVVDVTNCGTSLDGKDPDVILQGGKNGALQNSQTHLTREAKISLGVYHGLEFEAENDSMHFVARAYVVGNMLYQTLVVYPVGKPYADAARFLDSFQLIPRPQN